MPREGPVTDTLRRESMFQRYYLEDLLKISPGDTLAEMFIVSDVVLGDAALGDHPWSYADQELSIGETVSMFSLRHTC